MLSFETATFTTVGVHSLVFFGALLLTGCGGSSSSSTDADEDATNSTAPFVSAHRGGAAYAPENTMLAFTNAVRLGVDELEMDTQLTSDGRLVLLHDDTVDRTTNCSGAVSEMTLAQLRGCDAAFWFSPGQAVTRADEDLAHPLRGAGILIPTVNEVFTYVASLGANAPRISIEIKNIPGEANFDPTGQVVASALVPLIQAFDLTGNIVVQSFFPASIEAVKEMDPQVATQFLTNSGVGETDAFENLTYITVNGHEIAAPDFGAPDFDQSFVDAAHEADKLVVPYTADRLADIQLLIGLGVDGIITNYPACQLAEQGRPVPADPAAPELGDDVIIDACP